MYKGIEIVEAHAAVDHIHMLLKIPPKISISSFIWDISKVRVV